MQGEDEILFVQIREGEEIEKFKNWVKTPCITLLITRFQIDQVLWGNSSDDNVGSFQYDHTFHNDSSLEAAEFCGFLTGIFREPGFGEGQ